MVDEETGEIGTGSGLTPRRFSLWCLAACWFAMIANILGSFVDFWGEVSVGCVRHALWKDSRDDEQAEEATVGRFREQLADL